MATVAPQVDYSGWVKELDSFDTHATGDDPRDESANTNNCHGVDTATNRKANRFTKPSQAPVAPAPSSVLATSQAEELKQEMKLLNWHKLANEAALKAAIIKTNKLKSEDEQLASTFSKEDAQERQQRLQQVIEEEQLKPLQVNAEFFREFETHEQTEALRMENDVQRHLLHLQKLKQTLEQRESMRMRRLKYRQGVQELTKPNNNKQSMALGLGSTSRLGTPSSNNQRQDQEDYRAHSFQTRMEIQKQKDQTLASSQADVVNSLGKLVELEKRIRQLESNGALDDVDMTANAALSDLSSTLNFSSYSTTTNQHLDPLDATRKTKAKTNVKFQKRKHVASDGKEVSKTLYRVKMGQMAQTNTKLIHKKPKPTQRQQAASKSTTSIPGPAARSTFYLTSLPDQKKKNANRKANACTASGQSAVAKATSVSMDTTKRLERQRLLRNMSERERRMFLKQEKAQNAQQQAKKQDVVIVGWLQKKQEAARDRKKQSRNAAAAASSAAAGAASTRARGGAGGRAILPKVRAPMLGAASGTKVNNPHMQKFVDMKKSFEKRKEQWAKPSATQNHHNKRPVNNHRLAPLPKVNGAPKRPSKWSGMPPTRPNAAIMGATSATATATSAAAKKSPHALPRLAPAPSGNGRTMQFGLGKMPSKQATRVESSNMSTTSTSGAVVPGNISNVPPPSTLPRLKP